MSRRSSVRSTSVSAPPIVSAPSLLILDGPRDKYSRPDNLPHTASLSKMPTIDHTEKLDPDELFTKRTITEVKFIQNRYKADADAKQEELRLMVGERYRDLLQASTSIIAMAQSSRRVKDALSETRQIVTSQREPPRPTNTSFSDGKDVALHSLQVLSAHVKVLLDAPEYLWRLLEQRKYLSATWLFLLARVVHRALISEDETGEETWSRHDIDVLHQFPLVQRQWDVIAQFRSQIVQKANLSLREYTMSSEDTCGALLTLHLLDSKPLTDAYASLVKQRSRTLQTLLSRAEKDLLMTDKRVNGHTPETSSTADSSIEIRREPLAGMRETSHNALDVVFRTMKNVRQVFATHESERSLVRDVLAYIQSEPATDSNLFQSLPPELHLSTQSILMHLPSSTHFLLLPPNLRSYRPYVDPNSPSSTYSHLFVRQQLDAWFKTSSEMIHNTGQRWFAELGSVQEVWSFRSSTRKWVNASSLEGDEARCLLGILDSLSRERVIDIWKLRLSTAVMKFNDGLGSIISSLNSQSSSEVLGVDFLFQAPTLPVFSQIEVEPLESTLLKYQASLQRQLIGRTSLMDGIFIVLEQCAQSIQHDLSYVISSDSDTRELAKQIVSTYKLHADSSCNDLMRDLEITCNALAGETSLDGAVFLVRVLNEFQSSPFITKIACAADVVTVFRTRVNDLLGQIAAKWQQVTVSRIVKEEYLPYRPRNSSNSAPSSPSPAIVQSLFSLSDAIQQLGLAPIHHSLSSLTESTIRLFLTQYHSQGWKPNEPQSVFDLAFLREIARRYGPEWYEVAASLDGTLDSKLLLLPSIDRLTLQNTAAEALSRMQTLIATLLPEPSLTSIPEIADKSSSVHIPHTEQPHSTLELAMPTSRFGLLLVGASS